MKKLAGFLATCFLIAACASGNSYAQGTQSPEHPELSFQLDTDMVMFGSPTASLFLGWQRNANALFRIGLEGVSDYFDLHDPGKEFLRFGVLAVFAGAGYVVNQAFSLTAHDARHMDTARAIGGTGVSLVRIGTGQEMSIWEFFWEAFDFTSEPGLYT